MFKLLVLGAILAVALAVPPHGDYHEEKSDDAYPQPQVTRPHGFPYVFPYVSGGYPRSYPAYPYPYPYPYYYGGYHGGYHPGLYSPPVYHPSPSYSPGVLVYIGKFKGKLIRKSVWYGPCKKQQQKTSTLTIWAACFYVKSTRLVANQTEVTIRLKWSSILMPWTHILSTINNCITKWCAKCVKC